MSVDFKDLVWVVMESDPAGKWTTRQAFVSKQKALRLAGSIVGNNSYANPGDDIHIFGPGDGTTSVMVRQWPRALVLRDDVILTP
jgi:hypothetical protein